MPSKTQLFQVNRFPRLARIDLLPIARGIPPSKIPTGQRYLQKKGSASPTSLAKVIGSAMTKTARIPYFR